MEVNYRYNSKHENNIKECVEYIKSHSYGDTVTYYHIGKILRLDPNDIEQLNKLKYLMCRIKNILIDYGYVLKSVNGIGWYILKPQHISSYTYRNYIVKPQRAYEKAERILNHVDKTKFNDLQKQEHAEVKELNKKIQDVSWSTIKNSSYMEHKNLYE